MRRFSRQSTTELLVAAEQTANFLPYNHQPKSKYDNRGKHRQAGFFMYEKGHGI